VLDSQAMRDEANETTDDSDGVQEQSSTKGKRPTTRGKDQNEHCQVNFVKNTSYKLLADDSDKIWGEGKATDPAPAVPSSRSDSIKPGDYLLFSGNDITIKAAARGRVTVQFEPEEELILTSDWAQFDSPMTGGDLADLGENTFLLWWQNVQRPPVKGTGKKPAKAKGKGK
jgi:hypothetical protein